MPWARILCRIESTQEWVDVSQRTPLDEDAIHCIGVGCDGEFIFYYADWGNPSTWNQQKLDKAKVWIQEHEIDCRTRVADLPSDHPYKDVDPNLPYAFWESWQPTDEDPIETYLVERSYLFVGLDRSNQEGLTWHIERIMR
jgi:hypothetical protein